MAHPNSNNRRSQGALEYLITYGWAILIIVIIGGALFALGVFNPSSWTTNKRATGFSTVHVTDWVVIGTTPAQTVNMLTVVLSNKAGEVVNLNFLNTTGDATCSLAYSGVSLQPDSTTTATALCSTGLLKSGNTYTITVYVDYEANGLLHTDFGTITAKAE